MRSRSCLLPMMFVLLFSLSAAVAGPPSYNAGQPVHRLQPVGGKLKCLFYKRDPVSYLKGQKELFLLLLNSGDEHFNYEYHFANKLA